MYVHHKLAIFGRKCVSQTNHHEKNYYIYRKYLSFTVKVYDLELHHCQVIYFALRHVSATAASDNLIVSLQRARL